MLVILLLVLTLPREVHDAIKKIDWISLGSIPQYVEKGVPLPGYGLNRKLYELKKNKVEIPSKGLLIIGDEPGETLKVTDTLEYYGNVMLINDGVLLVDSGTFILHGNIFAMDSSKYLVYNGIVRYPQMMTYEWFTYLLGKSRMEVHNSSFYYNGFPYTLGSSDSATLIWDSVYLADWTTGGCWRHASAILNHVNLAGEWLFADSIQASFSNIDTLLSWFYYGEGDTVDFAFPPWENMIHLVMSDTVSGITGIDYSVTLDTIGYSMWGTILKPGAHVTFRDSKIRTVGIMGEGADSQDVSGLVNGLSYDDFTLPMSDRYFHLLNTSVMTWSLYPADSFILTFDHCIVGEVLSMDYSQVHGESYYLDGTGGHFQADGNSLNIAILTSFTSEIYTTGNGVALLVSCAMPETYGGIWSRNSSIIVLANCQFPGVPHAYDSSFIYVIGIDEPFYAASGTIVPIIGTAEMIEGPYSLLHFDHYNLYWALEGDTSIWNPIDNPHNYEVWKDTLGLWDTRGLPLGNYLIKLEMVNSYPDSFSILHMVILNREDTSGVEETRETERILRITSLQKAPRRAHLKLTLPRKENIDLKIYDISGKLIKDLYHGNLNPGAHTFSITTNPGTYIAVLKYGRGVVRRKFVVW